MEKDGVGRPSTYPTIMEGIKTRGYVEEMKGKKGALCATDLGLKVYSYLQKNFDDFIMDIKFTAALEDDLDIIENGKKKFLEVVGNTYNTMMTKIGTIPGSENTGGSGEKTGAQCCVCKSGTIIQRKGKFGVFFCCDQYPKCKSIFNKGEDGKFVPKEKGEGFKSHVVNKDNKCPECEKNKREGYLQERKGKYGTFWGCSLYPACNVIFKKDANGEFHSNKK
jgi:DNA topoisomerase-1